jgi:hypothetical protein
MAPVLVLIQLAARTVTGFLNLDVRREASDTGVRIFPRVLVFCPFILRSQARLLGTAAAHADRYYPQG